MSFLVILSAFLVALEVFFVVTSPTPVSISCLVFVSLMFVWTLMNYARSLR